MPEYIGFGGVNPNFTAEQRSFFTEAEKEIGVPIKLICGINNVGKTTPRDSSDISLIIHDFNVPGSPQYVSPMNLAHIGSPRRAGQSNEHIKLNKFAYYLNPDNFSLNDFVQVKIPGRMVTTCAYRYKEVFTFISLTNFSKSELKALDLLNVFKESVDDESVQKTIDKKFEQTLKNAAKSMKQAAGTEVTNIEKKIVQLEQEIAIETARTIQKYRSIQTESMSLKSLKKLSDKETDGFIDQLRQLKKNVHVDTIGWQQNQLLVKTNLMYLYSPTAQERVPLGEMSISLNKDGNILITNISNPKGDPLKPHPHITSEGAACWGGIQPQITKLVSQYEIVGLFETIFAYLENYNPEDDYGRHAPHWFDTQEIQHLQGDGRYLTEQQINEEVKQKSKSGKKSKDHIVDVTFDKPATTSNV